MKKIFVFSLFIFWPDPLSYTSNISKILLHSSSIALQNRSAKNKWETLGPLAGPILSIKNLTWTIQKKKMLKVLKFLFYIKLTN